MFWKISRHVAIAALIERMNHLETMLAVSLALQYLLSMAMHILLFLSAGARLRHPSSCHNVTCF